MMESAWFQHNLPQRMLSSWTKQRSDHTCRTHVDMLPKKMRFSKLPNKTKGIWRDFVAFINSYLHQRHTSYIALQDTFLILTTFEFRVTWVAEAWKNILMQWLSKWGLSYTEWIYSSNSPLRAQGKCIQIIHFQGGRTLDRAAQRDCVVSNSRGIKSSTGHVYVWLTLDNPTPGGQMD